MDQKAAEAFFKATRATQLTYQASEPDYHPFVNTDVMQASASMIELFLPADYFIHNPKKWNDFNSSNSALMNTTMNIVELFHYVSRELGDCSTKVKDFHSGVINFVPDQVAMFEVVPRRDVDEDDDGNIIHTDVSERKPAGYRLRIMAQASGNEDSDTAKMNAVHYNDGNEEDNNNNNGDEDEEREYERGKKATKAMGKKRYKPPPKETCPAIIIQKLLTSNKNLEQSNRKKRKSFNVSQKESKAVEFLYGLTLQKYVQICNVYTGSIIRYDEASASPLFNANNPANPLNVFSIERSMEKADMALADYECCKGSRYHNLARDMDEQTGLCPWFTVPYPFNVWRMNPCYLEPGNTTKVYWPMIESPQATQDAQRCMYIEKNARGLSEEARQKQGFIYDQCIASSTVTEEQSSDIDTLRVKYTAILTNIEASRLTSEEKAQKIQEAQHKALNDFSVVFSPDGDGPDALKAVARFMNDYLADNESFCLNLPKVSKNLTQFGDDMISLAITMETLWNVNTQHRDSLALLFKNLHVYALSAFNPHTGNFGPGMAGKSFGFLLVMKWLIKGTYVSTTYSSSKANVVPGHKNRCLIRFFEDVFPAFLGVHGGAGSKASETSNTDVEAINKAWLTSGVLSAHVLDTTYGRANAVSVELTAKVESVINICSNTTAHSVPYAMRSRYHVNSWQVKERLEGGGLLGKANKVSNPILKRSESLFIMRIRRNQALVCVILQLIYIGILPAVDMTVARIVFTQTLQRAKIAGLSGTEDIRNFERLEMVCRVLVIWDAINILWDSPDSVLQPDRNGKTLPHSLQHFLLVGRYLRSNVEHAVMTLGLLNNQYEDPIIDTILEDLKNTKFNMSLKHTTMVVSRKMVKTTTKQQQQQQEQIQFRSHEPGITRENANYYIAPFDALKLSKNNRIDNNSDRAKLLAQVQFQTMRSKPLWEDVAQGYQRLLEKMVKEIPETPEDEAKAKKDEEMGMSAKEIPALDFRDGNVYLSKHLVTEHGNNALQRCTEKAIRHKHATEAEYVYGSMRENNPFLYQTIKVGPNEPGSKKELHVLDPNFFEETLVKITERYIAPMAAATSKQKRKKQKQSIEASQQILEEDAEAAFSMKGAYAETPRKIIDMDLNDYADVAFLLKQNFTEEEISVMPSGDPMARKVELVERTEQGSREKLILYPNELPHFRPGKYYNDQQRELIDNPQKFSVRAHLQRLRDTKNGIQVQTQNSEDDDDALLHEESVNNADAVDEDYAELEQQDDEDNDTFQEDEEIIEYGGGEEDESNEYDPVTNSQCVQHEATEEDEGEVEQKQQEYEEEEEEEKTNNDNDIESEQNDKMYTLKDLDQAPDTSEADLQDAMIQDDDCE